jgi:hypothetical protein
MRTTTSVVRTSTLRVMLLAVLATGATLASCRSRDHFFDVSGSTEGHTVRSPQLPSILE